jgi:hypothetical protein
MLEIMAPVNPVTVNYAQFLDILIIDTRLQSSHSICKPQGPRIKAENHYLTDTEQSQGINTKPVTLKFSSVAAVKAHPPMMGIRDR